MPDRHPYGSSSLCLSSVGAHEDELRCWDASGEELRRRDVERVEGPKGMCRDERFGGCKNASRDFNQSPVRTIRGDTLQDGRQSRSVKRAVRDTSSQGAPQLDGQQG